MGSRWGVTVDEGRRDGGPEAPGGGISFPVTDTGSCTSAARGLAGGLVAGSTGEEAGEEGEEEEVEEEEL